MQAIDEELKLYRVDFGELTMAQIRKYFYGWPDDDKLCTLTSFYDEETDIFYIGPTANDSQIKFAKKALSYDPKYSLGRMLNYVLPDLQSPVNRCHTAHLIRAVEHRMELHREAEAKKNADLPANPNTKFITVDGDIFQISKIVSVKKLDEGGRHYLSFYITNKQASVRKEFTSKKLRDTEFTRIQKILESAA